MFNYLDRDNDKYLKYTDFVTLVQESNTIDSSLLKPALNLVQNRRYSVKG